MKKEDEEIKKLSNILTGLVNQRLSAIRPTGADRILTNSVFGKYGTKLDYDKLVRDNTIKERKRKIKDILEGG